MRNIIISLIAGSSFSVFIANFVNSPEKQMQVIKYQTVYKDLSIEFTEENFRKELAKYSWKYPDIVYAQAYQESGFSSKNFKKYNNLFGMKVAYSRLTTANKAEGTSHASYEDWQTSVMDRALYEASYLNNLTRDEYFSYLDRNYASDRNYIYKLKKIIGKIWKEG